MQIDASRTAPIRAPFRISRHHCGHLFLGPSAPIALPFPADFSGTFDRFGGPGSVAVYPSPPPTRTPTRAVVKNALKLHAVRWLIARPVVCSHPIAQCGFPLNWPFWKHRSRVARARRRSSIWMPCAHRILFVLSHLAACSFCTLTDTPVRAKFRHTQLGRGAWVISNIRSCGQVFSKLARPGHIRQKRATPADQNLLTTARC